MTPGNDRETSRRTDQDASRNMTSTDRELNARMTGTHDTGTERTGRREVLHTSGDDSQLRGLKTSAAAVFSLVFGLAALFCALTAILSPAAVVFGLIGLVLGIVGLKMAKRRGVTGRGVAIGGIVTAVLGLLLGAAVIAGISVLVNDEARLDQLQGWIDDRRADLPTTDELREELPGG